MKNRHLICGFLNRALLIAWLALALPLAARAQELSVTTDANVMVELKFTAQVSQSDPFNQVKLDVVFTTPAGRELRVPAFWAGGDQWRVRYASPEVGAHAFRSECSEVADRGLHGITGRVQVQPYHGKNPLYSHGPLRVTPGGRYLEHTDHTPFFWLADTWWMGLSHRLVWPQEFQQLAADRQTKGFNVIQIVAGLYPDMPPFDPRGANEAGFPWETNYARIRPEYFAAVDQRLGYLVEQGFTPCLVGAWGYFMPWMGVEKMKAHWRYLIARYGAWPVVWCAAGEANLPWYRAPGFPYDDRNQVHDWTEVMRFIRATDPYHRLLTIHPTAINQYTARHATDDPALLDFDLLQTPHGQREAVPVAIRAVRESYAAQPVMPVIDGEASYEMLSDRLPTEWTRRMFWICLMNGAAGHTYGANGIWQCNRPGDPHGASPTGGTYGKITWSEAMNLPGSGQIGRGAKLLQDYPWQQFQPHPEWASYVELVSPLSLAGASWIWFPEGNPAQDAPVAQRFFRRTFELPADQRVEQVRLRITADESFTAWLNGNKIGSGDNWHEPKEFGNLARALKPGKNLLAIRAENKAADVTANPAGLIARLEVRFVGGESMHLVSDAKWECWQTESPGWETNPGEISGGKEARILGAAGMAPWGATDAPPGEFFGPQATGIPGQVRIIYVPDPQAVRVQKLPPNATLEASYFDPIVGIRSSAVRILADEKGVWTGAPPPGCNHDWVLILVEAKKR